MALVNAVDPYFNLVSSAPANSVTFTTNDPAAPVNQGTGTLSGGTLSHAVTFFTPGNTSTTTATDSISGKTGTSDTVVVVGGGPPSSLMNVVHAAPLLSTGVFGQPVTMMIFQLSVNGSDPADLTGLILHARDSSGADVPMNTAFQTLSLISGSSSAVSNVSGVSSAFATLGASFPPGTFTVTPPGTLAVTLVGTIAASPTAKNVQLFVDTGASVMGKDDLNNNPTGTSSQGDPTGFAIASNLLVLLPANLASTYGNYPNPFRAGMENTTIEFFLQSPGSATLAIYDATGSKVVILLDNKALGAGLQQVPWDGRNGLGTIVLNGVYYGKLNAGGSENLLKIAVVQ